jgi:hypothetical protein
MALITLYSIDSDSIMFNGASKANPPSLAPSPSLQKYSLNPGTSSANVITWDDSSLTNPITLVTGNKLTGTVYVGVGISANMNTYIACIYCNDITEGSLGYVAHNTSVGGALVLSITMPVQRSTDPTRNAASFDTQAARCTGLYITGFSANYQADLEIDLSITSLNLTAPFKPQSKKIILHPILTPAK